MVKHSFPGPNDAYVEQHGARADWVKTQIVETQSGETKRAVVLVECSVNNPNRFVFLNGAWWKLEEPG